MIRRIALPALVGLAVLGTVPALADANGASEQQKVSRSCSAPADPHYSAPAATDCKTKGKFDKKKSYQSTYSSNNVTCGSQNALVPANPSGIQVNGNGSQASQGGQIGVCSDGSGPAPLQGRVDGEGSVSGGVTVTVDGDKDNNNAATDKGTGYAIVKAGPGGASAVCGKSYAAGGTGDSDNPVDASQASCG